MSHLLPLTLSSDGHEGKGVCSAQTHRWRPETDKVKERRETTSKIDEDKTADRLEEKGGEESNSVSLMKMSGCLTHEGEEGERGRGGGCGETKQVRRKVRIEGVSLFDQL